MELDGKIALVTGAGRGIGKGIALTFTKEGADVVVNDVDGGNAEATALEVRALGRRSMAIRADVAKQGEVNQMVEQVITTGLAGGLISPKRALVPAFLKGLPRSPMLGVNCSHGIES